MQQYLMLTVVGQDALRYSLNMQVDCYQQQVLQLCTCHLPAWMPLLQQQVHQQQQVHAIASATLCVQGGFVYNGTVSTSALSTLPVRPLAITLHVQAFAGLNSNYAIFCHRDTSNMHAGYMHRAKQH
jgi:hypothetical protein